MSLPEAMFDRVLERLELTDRAEPTVAGLSAVYPRRPAQSRARVSEAGSKAAPRP
jgi:hypothetical protein